jgi:hypothetical protein
MKKRGFVWGEHRATPLLRKQRAQPCCTLACYGNTFVLWCALTLQHGRSGQTGPQAGATGWHGVPCPPPPRTWATSTVGRRLRGRRGGCAGACATVAHDRSGGGSAGRARANRRGARTYCPGTGARRPGRCGSCRGRGSPPHASTLGRRDRGRRRPDAARHSAPAGARSHTPPGTRMHTRHAPARPGAAPATGADRHWGEIETTRGTSGESRART